MEGKNAVRAGSFTRRSFIKGTAGIAGLAAVGLAGTGCASSSGKAQATQPEETVYQGLCRGNCGGGCRISVHVREGKVVKTSPMLSEEDPLDNLICARGYTHAQRIYAPERIQYPMRRVEGTPRGNAEWERISWDDAIAEIVEKWQRYREEFGNSSIAYTYGAGTYAQNYYIYMRLWNSIGATKIMNEADMTMLQYSWKMFGLNLYMVGNSRKDTVNAHTVFIWGTNATVGSFNRWKYLMEARDRGAQIIVIDPTYTLAAQKADLWVPIKPTTDAALAMGMMKYWYDNGLDDKEYLRDLTVAPFLVRQDTGKFLRADEAGIPAELEQTGGSDGGGWSSGSAASEKYPIVVLNENGEPALLRDTASPQIEAEAVVNGIPVKTAYTMLIERCSEWTVEAVSQKCEISEETVIKLAQLYLDGPTTLHTGFGVDHRSNGDGVSHALCVLPLVSGQVGKKGAGIQGNLSGATTGFSGDNWTAVVTSHYTPGSETNMTYLPQIMEEKSWNGQPMDLKALFCYAGNPLGSQSGTALLREAWDKFELIVTADTVWSTTAKFSDIVLPVPHWFEYETYRTCPNDYLDFNDAAIPPQFESKPDTEIISLLGKALGLGSEFEFTNDDIHALFLDSDVSRSMGVSWDILKEKKHIKMAPDDYNYGSREIPWGTEYSRAIFYFDDVVPRFDQTKEIDTWQYALPFQVDPFEGYEDDPLRERFPINLITHRDKFKVHTAFAKCPWLLEIQPEPTVEINPLDAEEFGIEENDYVKCYNDRGFVVLKAHLDAAMRPGMAWTEHTWLDDQYVAGHYPDVTSLKCTHFFPTNTPFDCMVAIEKYTEGE